LRYWWLDVRWVVMVEGGHYGCEEFEERAELRPLSRSSEEYNLKKT
jgi:hypothetical protein